MDDMLIVNLIWVVIGSIVVYYVDKKAHHEGITDAIAMHNSGQLTYTSHRDICGGEIITMEIKKDEG